MAHTEIYTLSLHDALPIYTRPPDTRPGVDPLEGRPRGMTRPQSRDEVARAAGSGKPVNLMALQDPPAGQDAGERKRSEEHTSELQSRLHLVCRLLLVKKIT